MKIYINQFNLHCLNEIVVQLDGSIVSAKKGKKQTDHLVVVYTDENMYLVKDDRIESLHPVDKKIHIYKSYFSDYELITDPSYFETSLQHCILGREHFSKQIEKIIYYLNSCPDIRLVLEFSRPFSAKNVADAQTMTPTDFYMESNTNVHVNDMSIRRQIIEFLLLLN